MPPRPHCSPQYPGVPQTVFMVSCSSTILESPKSPGGTQGGERHCREPLWCQQTAPRSPRTCWGVPPGWEHLGFQHQQWLPGKPTDFQGSVGGKVCVEEVLRLQVTVDDSVFMQILQRERENRNAEREGGKWTLGRWPGLAGPGTGAQPHMTPVLSLGPPLFPPETSAGCFSGAEEGHFPCQVSIFKPSVAMETPFPADPCRGAAVTFPQHPSRSLPSSDPG